MDVLKPARFMQTKTLNDHLTQAAGITIKPGFLAQPLVQLKGQEQ
mgnify:CR=1 FL=1